MKTEKRRKNADLKTDSAKSVTLMQSLQAEEFAKKKKKCKVEKPCGGGALVDEKCHSTDGFCALLEKNHLSVSFFIYFLLA